MNPVKKTCLETAFREELPPSKDFQFELSREGSFKSDFIVTIFRSYFVSFDDFRRRVNTLGEAYHDLKEMVAHDERKCGDEYRALTILLLYIQQRLKELKVDNTRIEPFRFKSDPIPSPVQLWVVNKTNQLIPSYDGTRYICFSFDDEEEDKEEMLKKQRFRLEILQNFYDQMDDKVWETEKTCIGSVSTVDITKLADKDAYEEKSKL